MAEKKKKEESSYPLEHRIEMFEKLLKEYNEEVEQKPREPITISLLDGRKIDATAWETTPLNIAESISKSLAKRVVIAKVDGTLFDLVRPFEKSCTLELLDFESDDGKKVFWHSSAHVLGEACELHYGCHLCLGPPIDDGFFYEMGSERPVTLGDYQHLNSLTKRATSEEQPFQRLVVTKENLLEMFKHNKYKQYMIGEKVPDGTSTTVYRCGPLIDLCTGPHIPHTGRIKAIKVVKNSSSYFLADAKNDTLQRVYGISFPEAKMMKEWEKFMEEAEKRDHRRIGIPNGARIYNTLLELQKSEYWKRGFQEVITPNMYNTKLWETSGHLANYKDDMFTFDIDKEMWALKPMNCPGHCVIFKHRERSYRELPLRLADFGVIHRNEASGALSGLTRVRRFQQDDAHIFCRVDQIKEEMNGCLDFLRHVYGIFGFTFRLALSTRPEKFLGEIATWDKAEELLRESLNDFGYPWELNEGDGAFYGPKIDITITDALRRKHQCATIQLDFQLPERFKLDYRTDNPESPFARPVMIHRAVLGSLERMIAILTENYGGKWPFWLSPRQVVVIPIANTYYEYAEEVQKILHENGLHAEVDVSGDMFKKKIRNAEIAHINFIMVVGGDEQASRSVNVRNRDDPNSKARGQVVSLDAIVEKLVALKKTRAADQTI
ncbi:threonyl-tRNA synthetase [Boothiomyces macroporosus]|uniref:Probable threonine--tRNA ligase, cytoplasmic n=1 Tax=Boothiomyces macroporosus TaxID=261099 RepID=A0AAD5Y2I6_9FUNG|nr:threonyl-tRNA synthetase [Boothiomyces macroporosus]